VKLCPFFIVEIGCVNKNKWRLEMGNYLNEAIGYEKSSTVEDCDFCGAKFRLSVPGQDGHEEREEYYCPECGKNSTCRASNRPSVDLIDKRTDNRTISYSQFSKL